MLGHTLGLDELHSVCSELLQDRRHLAVDDESLRQNWRQLGILEMSCQSQMYTMFNIHLEDGLDKLGLRGLDNAGRDDGDLVTEGGAGDGGQGLDVVPDGDLAQGTGAIISLGRNIHGLDVINNLRWGRSRHFTHQTGIVWSRDKVRLEWDEGSWQGLVAGRQGGPGVGEAQAGLEDVQGGPEGEEGGGEGGVSRQRGGAEILDCRHALQHYQGDTHNLQQGVKLDSPDHKYTGAR